MLSAANEPEDNTQEMSTTENIPGLWADDKLNRADEASFLTTYLTNKYELTSDAGTSSFVLNINADWGTGKTYFLLNWQKHLEEELHPVVHFNAWENDFSNSPLLGFISEINDSVDQLIKDNYPDERASRIVKNKLTGILKSVAPLIAGQVSKKLTGLSMDEIKVLLDDAESDESSTISTTDTPANSTKDIEKAVSTFVTKASTAALQSHNNTKQAITEFKHNLEALVKLLGEHDEIKLPLFIFVDELDRCRPNYAIELLETIKHLFEVKGVFFVVATASEQLSHSIKAIYGAQFESKRYLSRFFDQEYKLAQPDRYNFCELLWGKQIGENSRLQSVISDTSTSGCDMNVVLLMKMADYTKASQRDIERVLTILQAIDLTESENLYSLPLMFLAFCKVCHPNFWLCSRLLLSH